MNLKGKTSKYGNFNVNSHYDNQSSLCLCRIPELPIHIYAIGLKFTMQCKSKQATSTDTHDRDSKRIYIYGLNAQNFRVMIF